MSRQDEIHEGEDAIDREIIKAIVFLAMYCEAYIWDLAASVLGDNYTHKYLDKLDTFSKWVIIHQLLFGESIDPGHHSMEKLKELIRWRNNFVHSKSKNGTGIQEDFSKFEHYFVPLGEQIDLDGMFKQISELFDELQKLDPAGIHRL